MDSNHYVPVCWITKKPHRPLGHNVLYIYIREIYLYLFTCAHHIKITRPFGLHYTNVIFMWVLHDPWVCNISLHDPCVCTIITMWVRPSVRPWSFSENANHAHYCQLITLTCSYYIDQTISIRAKIERVYEIIPPHFFILTNLIMHSRKRISSYMYLVIFLYVGYIMMI